MRQSKGWNKNSVLKENKPRSKNMYKHNIEWLEESEMWEKKSFVNYYNQMKKVFVFTEIKELWEYEWTRQMLYFVYL